MIEIFSQGKESNDDQNKSANKQCPQKSGSFLDLLKFILLVAIIVVPIRIWIAQPFLVSGASMEPTYKNGEYLIVDEISYKFQKPKKDEVIIFHNPKDPKIFFIKRIIGLPNENLIIDGREIKLKDNEYFVMGDNRDASSDSRIWGPVPGRLIVGRSMIRLWPLNKIGLSPGY